VKAAGGNGRRQENNKKKIGKRKGNDRKREYERVSDRINDQDTRSR